MPTAATADAASCCVIERNLEQSRFQLRTCLRRSRRAGPVQSRIKVTAFERGLTMADMLRDLLAREKQDVRAAEAVAMFCYQARKWIGAFTAALGGLDTLIFAGGIGENAPVVRARICDRLQFLGLKLDQKQNKHSAPIISTTSSKVTVRVIRTDEEIMLARYVARVLGLVKKSK